MKQLSIRKKIMLWFSAMLLIIVLLITAMTFAIASSVLNEGIRERLYNVVSGNVNEIEYLNSLKNTEAEAGDQFIGYGEGWLEIDDDFCDVYEGISTALYDAEGNLLYGNMPIKFSSFSADDFAKIGKTEYKGETFYVFDKSLTAEGMEGLWLRGVVSQNESINVLYNIVRLSFWLLPALALLAILGGYVITRRSFLPIEQIARDAEEIGGGSDLSKRLDIGEGNDEIHMLCDSFNEMFSRLEKNFDAEKQFASDASHELRTPLSVILAEAQYAIEFCETPDEFREALSVIERQGGKMGDIISQLLFFTRLSQGTESVSRENLCVSDLVCEICDEQRIIPQKGIELCSEIEPEIYGDADRSLLSCCLNNLISNAYKYGKEKGHIWVGLRRHAGQILISVKDDGIGISKENLPKIWERFYQEDSARGSAEGKGGVGLGLSLVKEIAGLLDMEIEVNSAPDKGSEFILKL